MNLLLSCHTLWSPDSTATTLLIWQLGVKVYSTLWTSKLLPLYQVLPERSAFQSRRYLTYTQNQTTAAFTFAFMQSSRKPVMIAFALPSSCDREGCRQLESYKSPPLELPAPRSASLPNHPRTSARRGEEPEIEVEGVVADER